MKKIKNLKSNVPSQSNFLRFTYFNPITIIIFAYLKLNIRQINRLNSQFVLSICINTVSLKFQKRIEKIKKAALVLFLQLTKE